MSLPNELEVTTTMSKPPLLATSAMVGAKRSATTFARYGSSPVRIFAAPNAATSEAAALAPCPSTRMVKGRPVCFAKASAECVDLRM